MKNSGYFPLTLLLLLALISCDDKKEVVDPGVDFNVTFKATYEGSQLEKNNTYYLGNIPISFVRYRLYLSDISLLKEDGGEVVISPAEYLDFTADNGASNMSLTPKITFKNVPEGSYSGIKMGFGVNPVNNAKKPSNFSADSPLAIETDYWLAWKSYIFMVLDGQADPDIDGTKNLALSYHCGSDPVYRVFTFNEHIHVAPDHPGIGIEFDIRRLLTNDDGSPYDIVTNPATSNSVNDTRVAAFIMDNFDAATTIKQ